MHANERKQLNWISSIGFLVCLYNGGLAQGPDRLRVGDHAPAVEVAYWLQGDPRDFSANKVRVVDFWATWCGPCEVSIPRLGALARRFQGQVSVVGVCSYEVESSELSSVETVRQYVESKRGQLTYAVAVDTRARDAAKAWMDAAGRNEIPCAFVIGRDNRVKFIGHPEKLEEVLPAIVAGTYKPGDENLAAKAAERAFQAQNRSRKRWLPGILAALRAGERKRAAQRLRQAIEVDPLAIGVFTEALVDDDVFTRDPALCERYASLFGPIGFSYEKTVPFDLADLIIRKPKPFRLKHPSVLVRLASMTAREYPHSPDVLKVLAEAYALTGNYREAIRLEEDGMAHLHGEAYKDPFWREQMLDDLARYRRALGSKLPPAGRVKA